MKTSNHSHFQYYGPIHRRSKSKCFTTKILEIINHYSQVARYKIKSQKLIAFLNVNNKNARKKKREGNNHFHNRLKMPWNKSKDVKDLYNETFKSLKREIEEDTQ